MSTLTVIPAKGSSSRLPGKNKALLCGKPLVQYAVEQAFDAGVCGEVCVVTDDEVIAEIARRAGAKVPYMRRDDVDSVTPASTAALNCLRWYRQELGQTFDLVCMLLTTSPLRSSGDVKACREILVSNPQLDASMTFTKVEDHPYWAWQIDNQNLATVMFPEKCDFGRNQLQPAFFADGAVYWARADFFERESGNQYRGRIGGFVMPAERAVDIDTELNFRFAEFLLSKAHGQ